MRAVAPHRRPSGATGPAGTDDRHGDGDGRRRWRTVPPAAALPGRGALVAVLAAALAVSAAAAGGAPPAQAAAASARLPASASSPDATAGPARAGVPDEAEAREAALARDNAARPLLGREELRRCLYEQLRLSAETDSLAEATGALEAERGELARLGAELKARAEALDRADRAAVDAYNAQAESRNARIARHVAAAAKVEERTRAIEPARLAWSRDCSGRAFRQEDRDAIETGR